jgi:hypothetical protein
MRLGWVEITLKAANEILHMFRRGCLSKFLSGTDLINKTQYLESRTLIK